MKSTMVNEILHNTQIGLWGIEISFDHKPKMYGDNIMMKLFGINEELSPEEMYNFWYTRIHPDYIEYINNEVERIKCGEKGEVEYPWNHPQLGWIYLRSGGSLNNSYKKDGVIFTGYHQDVTDLLGFNIEKFKDHKIMDLYKLKKYSSYYMENYDELFEVDLENYTTKTIFYRKNKYALIKENHSIFDLVKEHVYKDDVDNFNHILQPETIKKMIDGNTIERVDFRTKTKNGEFEWVRAVCFIAELNRKKKLIFYIYSIEDRKKVEILSKEKEDILRTLLSGCAAIIDVNLKLDQVKVLKGADEDVEILKILLDINKFTNNFINGYIDETDKEEAAKFLSLSNLKKVADEKKEKHIDLKLKSEKFKHELRRISVIIMPNLSERVFILFKSISNDYLLQKVIEKFVYNNCDYVYYIDLKNNWFLRFSGNENNTPLPEREGDNYIKAMIEYVDEYVPIEDREMVKTKIHPEYVVEALNRDGILNFTTGVIKVDGSYARKNLQFQYYDEENKIVLLQSKDITENYMNNKKNILELEMAKKYAVTDYLTGIYNRLGCEKEIKIYMDNNPDIELSAFLLIDLDNFKEVNDHLGHEQGDKVLKEVAHILKTSFRSTDILARLGGDEFVIFMKDVKKKEVIFSIVEQLLEKICLRYENEKVSVQIGASIGIALAPKHGTTFKELYNNADNAMYYVKHRGKNEYHLYDGRTSF